MYGLENMQSSYCFQDQSIRTLTLFMWALYSFSNVLYYAHSITEVVVCLLYADDELIYLSLYLPDSPLSLSLLVLYILLGVLAGALVLCWCCWSPGWFVWRVSICRFLPCCNSVCASCQLCARSCTNSKEHRLAKVTPHTPTNGASAGAGAITHSADENVNMSAV